MAKPSVNQLLKDGAMKRADAYKIEFWEMHVEPGFNPEGRFEIENEEDVALYDFIVNGGITEIEPLRVRVRQPNGVWIVDGHRRHAAISMALKNGFLNDALDENGILWMPVRFFEGNDADRLTAICTTNDGKKLTPLQRGDVYARMKALGMTLQEIAKRVNKSLAHVEQALILKGAPYQVQQMVRNGEISATLAIQQVREHGENATNVLQAAKNSLTEKPDATKTSPTRQDSTAPRITPKAFTKVTDKQMLNFAESQGMQLLDAEGNPVASGSGIREALKLLLENNSAAESTTNTPDMFEKEGQK